MNVNVANDSLQSKLYLLWEDLGYGIRRIDHQDEVQRFVRASDANWNVRRLSVARNAHTWHLIADFRSLPRLELRLKQGQVLVGYYLRRILNLTVLCSTRLAPYLSNVCE